MSDNEFDEESFAKYRAKKTEENKAAAMAAAQADPELLAIMTETRQVQQDTVVSARNAAKTIKDTVVVADKTTTTLKAQGEHLEKIGQTAEHADKNAQESYQSARELHKYKGFLPVSMKNMFTGGKKKHQDSELEKINAKLDKQAKKMQGPPDAAEPDEKAAGANSPAPHPSSAGQPKKVYADMKEQEIDENLDDISSGLDHLKATGLQMQSEMAKQDLTITKIKATTEHTDYTLNSANRKIKEFM